MKAGGADFARSRAKGEWAGRAACVFVVLGSLSAANAASDPLLERPLFAPDRRAPAVAAVAVQADATPVLTGVVTRAGARIALFSVGDKPVIAGPGAALGAWRVADIGADWARITRDTEAVTLHARFAPPAP